LASLAEVTLVRGANTVDTVLDFPAVGSFVIAR
jgi:hypothetical protein